ncbi:MAG: O-antigen ligase family protein [Lachnospiraceae bacterium]|nr:O-antigen ligase family protein [Lachnospiraceae bacterium]
MLENDQVSKQEQTQDISASDKSIHKQGRINKIGNVLVILYFLILTIIYPFFIKDGYHKIGETKYFFFRKASLIITTVIIFIAIVDFTLKRKSYSAKAFYQSVSLTDCFVYVYFISVLISYICTPYAKDALWGADGWYMGLVSQLLFISIYFIFSRYFRWDNKSLFVILFISGLVFLLGILNRYSIYPIKLSGQTPVFISTLGNINWFCGYWAVICPLGVVFYWNSESVWQRAVTSIYVIIGFLIGVVQGSSSAYLVLAGLFVFLFSLSFEKNKAMYRLIQLCIMFMLSCQVARILRYLPDFAMNYENELGTALTDSNLTLCIGMVLSIVYILLYHLFEKKGIKVGEYKNIRNITLAVIVAITLIYIIILVVNTHLPKGIFGSSENSLFTFNESWGSHRGATWSIGISAFLSMSPLYKVVGIGPDCFADYIYSIPGLSEYVYAQFGSYRLTNAHNEWITLLVNQGILGLACYAGIFVTAFIRFIKRAGSHPPLYLCAASILLYTVHNIVSFQQVLNAPFVFMVLGIGEGICRKNQNR